MGKASKWLRSLLTGKKEKAAGSRPCPLPLETHSGPVFSVPSNPKEKRRWSFRRSAARGSSSSEQQAAALGHSDSEVEEKRHARAMPAASATATQPKSAVATKTNAREVAGADTAQAVAPVLLPKSAAATGTNAAETTCPDATFAAAQAAVMQLKSAATSRTNAAEVGAVCRTNAAEVGAAIRIQAVFRSYLARKALCALKGLVKLQALVRGHLVRKQAAATLRCMQALVRLQARARVKRIQMLEEARQQQQQPPSPPCDRRPPQHSCRRCYYEMDQNTEENVKIVEMDLGETCSSLRSTSSYSATPTKRDVEYEQQYGCGHVRRLYKSNSQQQFSPVSTALTDNSPRAYGRMLGESCSVTAQDSPQHSSATSAHDGRRSFTSNPPPSTAASNDHHLFFPNYMANTESSRAKVRSQSAPKQRSADACDRPPIRRRTGPAEGTRGVPKSSRMQRSSSHVGSSTEYYYPWSIKLDRSNVSLKESECGSTSTVLSKANCYDHIN